MKRFMFLYFLCFFSTSVFSFGEMRCDEYLDHRKGNRKEQDNSPEWISQRM